MILLKNPLHLKIRTSRRFISYSPIRVTLKGRSNLLMCLLVWPLVEKQTVSCAFHYFSFCQVGALCWRRISNIISPSVSVHTFGLHGDILKWDHHSAKSSVQNFRLHTVKCRWFQSRQATKVIKGSAIFRGLDFSFLVFVFYFSSQD